MHRWRGVLNEVCDELMHRSILQHMIVVEYNAEGFGAASQVAQQLIQHPRRVNTIGRAEKRAGWLHNVGGDPCQGGTQGDEEVAWGIIASLKC